MRVLLAIALSFALASALEGCVGLVPPAVTIASYAVDGVSYLATGKSATDHAVSGVAGEDCVLLRAAMMKNPCRPYPTPDSELAVELETNYGGEDVSTELADADLAAGGHGAATAVAARRSSAPTTLAQAKPTRAASARTERAGAAPTRTEQASRFVVVGSFRERANAERARRANAARGATIVPASVNGRSYYRVITPAVARPHDARDGAGWAIAPCGAGAGRSPCLDHAAMASVRAMPAKRATSVAERPTRPESQLSESPMTARRPEIGG